MWGLGRKKKALPFNTTKEKTSKNKLMWKRGETNMRKKEVQKTEHIGRTEQDTLKKEKPMRNRRRNERHHAQKM